MHELPLAPHIQVGDRVVLFDGVCKLCAAWARFLIRFDRHHAFKLCAVQSAEGQTILSFYRMPTDRFETMALIEGPTLHTRSDAFFGVMRRLPFPWPLVFMFAVVPRPVRDWLYDRIALNRYRLFGRFEHCMLPAPDHERRFLKA